MAHYSYDTLWRRLEKKSWNVTVRYTYSGNNAIVEEQFETQIEYPRCFSRGCHTEPVVKTVLEETKENIYSNSLDDILAVTITKDWKSKKYMYHKNHLGSIVSITDEKWKLLEEYKYDVFGKAFTREGKSDTFREFEKSKINNSRLYTGREFDRETGLYYLRARYYSADLGRFISRDPIWIADDLNLYAYVGNSPVMGVDLMGVNKVLIIVWSEKVDWEFTSSIYFYHNKFLKEGIKEENIIYQYESIELLNSSIQEYKDTLKEIIYIAHWNPSGVWIIWLNDVNKITSLNDTSSNIVMTLVSCNTWNWENSIWEALSTQLWIEVIAPSFYVKPTDIWADTNYFESLLIMPVYGTMRIWHDYWEPTIFLWWGEWKHFIHNK